MAVITQGSLKKLREKMFDHMQDLPIKYFDTNGHGDIMSYSTNDVDTLRQMISQSRPQMMISGVTLLAVFCICLLYTSFAEPGQDIGFVRAADVLPCLRAARL